MPTVTHIKQFRGLSRFDLSPRAGKPLGRGMRLRELWSDGVATLAVVTLASVVAFEALRVFMW